MYQALFTLFLNMSRALLAVISIRGNVVYHNLKIRIEDSDFLRESSTRSQMPGGNFENPEDNPPCPEKKTIGCREI